MNFRAKNPWLWVPSLYFAEGLPYFAVTSISLMMYKNLGLSNAEIAFYTSWLNFPWVIKCLWSPFVDLLKTKRWWILSSECLIGAGLAGIAFCIPAHFYLQATLAIFWLLAFASATHDIAADGFYMLGLTADEQTFFVGIRNAFYKVANLFGQGTLIYFAGMLEKKTGNIPFAWSLTFLTTAGLFLAFFAYHRFSLPNPVSDQPDRNMEAKRILKNFALTFKTFFTKKQAGAAVFFMLTYRFSEAQLLKLIQPFLLDTRDKGGLGLETEQVGLIYGIVGVVGLLLGGIVGGILAVRGGLKKWLWPMLLSMLVTSATFVYLAYFLPDNGFTIRLCVFIEQFGYGFGFTAYTLFLIYYSEGEQKTAHYAICTGLMSLGMMLPGMAAGWIQEKLGYPHFFLWVMVCSVVPIIATALLKVDDKISTETQITPTE
ncbi:MAG: MFS transporter [Candidatus Azobacteroides sp.]|nr:MFS transporter [Candidatus Azobacteroides sp.]